MSRYATGQPLNPNHVTVLRNSLRDFTVDMIRNHPENAKQIMEGALETIDALVDEIDEICEAHS